MVALLMMYCRYSDDDFKCDISCHESTNGKLVTCVAAKRIEPSEPLPAPVSLKEGYGPWIERHREMMRIIRSSPLVPIQLEHAGETFDDDTLPEFLARLKKLRDIGYRVPDRVIETVESEIREQAMYRQQQQEAA